MDFGHARRFATRQAALACGDLYPGPILMPRAMLRAIDPLLAVGLGPPRHRGEAFLTALDRTLRGRPDGPLLLALWGTQTAGEISSADLSTLVHLMPEPLPDQPRTRAELLGFLEPRVSVMTRCILSVAQRTDPETLAAAQHLGCGLALTRLVVDLPWWLQRERMPLPTEELEAAQCSLAELSAGILTPGVRRYWMAQAEWANEQVDAGLEVTDRVGARLGRGLRAAVLRARWLLQHNFAAGHDPFRRRTRISGSARWACAVRAYFPLTATENPPGDARS